MSAPDNQHLLIIQSVSAKHQGLSGLLQQLAGQSAIDPFIARQRLIGRGPNLLAKGSREQLEPIAGLVTGHELSCWLIAANRPHPAPVHLRGLRTGASSLTLFTSGEEMRLERGGRAMAVLADLSGNVVTKQLRREMAGKIFNGTENTSPLDDDELYRAILRGQPVLDIYLFDETGKARPAIRVLPGRFDPQGLGENKKLGAAANLEQVLNLVRDMAGAFTLSLDFGLVNLPGCHLQKADENLRMQRGNLESLARFGSLLTEMAAAGPFAPTPATGGADLLPFATNNPGDLAYVNEVLEEIRADNPSPAPSERGRSLPETDSASVSLPPPPDRSEAGNRGRVGIWSLLGGAAGTGLYLLADHPDFWKMIYRFGIRPGILPAVLSSACLWGGFHFLRLKRRVENTPTSRIRSVAMGLVEVQGRTLRKFSLVSPMTLLPCVYYRLRRFRRNNENEWRLTSTSDSGHVPFYLEDDSGVLTVNPAGAKISAGHKQTGYDNPSNLLFASSSGFDGDEKWVEEVIAEGTRLYVLGEATENRRTRPPLQEQLTLALRTLKRNRKALERYDADGDGAISAEEWNRARRDVEERLLHQNLGDRSPDLPLRDRVVIRRPRQRSLPFIVAETASEAHLVRSYGLYTVPLFGGALLAVLWTLAMLANFLQLT
jgi:hypothetical protein